MGLFSKKHVGRNIPRLRKKVCKVCRDEFWTFAKASKRKRSGFYRTSRAVTCNPICSRVYSETYHRAYMKKQYKLKKSKQS